MMAKLIGKIMAATGKYIKEGAEKTSWTKCGVLMETDKGFRIKLDAVPLGGDGWFAVFEEDNQHQSQGSAPKPASAPSGAVGDDDDIPF